MNTFDVPRRVMGSRALATLVLSALAVCPPPMPVSDTVAAPAPYAPEVPPPEGAPEGLRPNVRWPKEPAPPKQRTMTNRYTKARAKEKARRKEKRRLRARSGA